MLTWIKKIHLSQSCLLNIKLLVIAIVVLMISSVIINKTSSHLLNTSKNDDYNLFIRKIVSIKNQTQDIAFIIPNIVYSSDRKELHKVIQEKLPILQNLKEELLNMHLNTSEEIINLKDSEKKKLFEAYALISKNLTQIFSALETLQDIPQFEDMDEYIIKIQHIIDELSHFPDFTQKPLSLKPFSLK